MNVCVLVTQLCLTLSDHMNCSPPGSSVHGILQARILDWVAISFSECYIGFTLKSYSHPVEILKYSPRFLQIPGSLHSLGRTLLPFPVPSELFHSLIPHIHLLLSSLQWSTREIQLAFLNFPNSNLLQYSCLESFMNRGAWWATVHGISKSQTWLSD